MDDRWKRPHHNIDVQTIDISKSMTKHTKIEKKNLYINRTLLRISYCKNVSQLRPKPS